VVWPVPTGVTNTKEKIKIIVVSLIKSFPHPLPKGIEVTQQYSRFFFDHDAYAIVRYLD
jgi:hypothetical protein